jgi:hypothetical protein
MKTLLKKQEKKKTQNQRSGATFRIDQALISKFGGTRKPTSENKQRLTLGFEETVYWLSSRNRSR